MDAPNPNRGNQVGMTHFGPRAGMAGWPLPIGISPHVKLPGRHDDVDIRRLTVARAERGEMIVR